MDRNPSLLTIIIPAYQEEKRIGKTLNELCKYFCKHGTDVEILVVSCASTDNTVGVARQYEDMTPVKVRVMDVRQIKGKGAAVRTGVLKSSGIHILFTDADLSYAPELFDQFISRLKDGADMVVAQRIGDEKYSGLGRYLLGRASRFVAGNLITPGIRDTQAGLKAFTRSAAEDLFSRQKVNGFLFDLEILLLARKRGYRVEQVYVNWEDKPGSTYRLVRDTSLAVLDLTKIFWRLVTGRYAK